MDVVRRQPWPFWWVLASLALMAAGALGPWEEFSDSSVTSVDLQGRKMFEAVGVGVLGLALYRRRAAILMAVGGLLGASVCEYERHRINVVEVQAAGLIDVDVGWALYVSLVASLSLVVAGVALRTSAVAAQRSASGSNARSSAS
jgi:hypothetical protein